MGTEVVCGDIKAAFASGDTTFSVQESVRTNDSRSVERELTVSGRSVSGALPNQGVMLLWGRHSSKFVETNGFRFVALAPGRRQPMTVAVYGHAPGSGWTLAFADAEAKAHQPPTLHLDANGNLHLLYAEYMTGRIRHRTFARVDGVLLRELPEQSTAAWGEGNFYIGTAIDESRKRIVGCAQNFTSHAFRCAQFVGGKWEMKLSRYMGPHMRLLYPNISAGRSEALVVSSGYEVGSPNGARTGTDVFRVNYGGQSENAQSMLMQDVGGGSDGSGELLAHMGSKSVSGEGVFDEDIVRDEHGLHVLLTGLRTGDLSMLEIDGLTPEKRLVRLPARWGSAHNLQRVGANLAVIGAGRILHSSDRGHSWSETSYVASGYPRDRYEYLAAHTLKVETPFVGKTILFLQEVRDRESNDLEVVEVEVPANALAPKRQTAELRHE